MMLRLGLVLGVCAAACGAFGATADDFALKMEKLSDTQIMVVASWKVNGLQGWSFGICHSAAQAAIGACAGGVYTDCTDANTKCPSVVCTQQLLTAKTGGPPQFVSINAFDTGITQGVVVDFMQVVSLNAADRFELMTIAYTLKAASAPLEFCNTLGSPATDTVFVHEGNSIAPATKDGVTLGGVIPTCDTLKMGLAKVGEDKAAVTLDTITDQAPTGFSFGVADDSAAVIVSAIDAGSAVDTLMGGADPEYWGFKAVTGGATLGCVFSMGATVKALPACTANQQIAIVSYINTSGQSATANVTLSSALGSPAVPVVVDVDGTSFEPTIGAGVSVTVGGGQPPFVRGDVNQDGKVNVSDGVAIARYVFGLGTQKAKIDNCKDSADANDDGTITTADALYVLNYLFTGGPAITAPTGSCGTDTTADTLDCVQYQCP